MTPADKGLAILGGTFDPVHFGHLRSAVEIKEALHARKVKLIPSFLPPHREQPGSTPQQRLEMLELATRQVDFLEVDDREVRREGRSFTIDTLHSLREEVGDDVPLHLVIGIDAWAIIDSWRAWERLIDFAHIVILARGDEEPEMPAVVTKWACDRLADGPGALQESPHGLICRVDLTRLDISSTRIRRIFSMGLSPDYLMPREIIDYIRERELYR